LAIPRELLVSLLYYIRREKYHKRIKLVYENKENCMFVGRKHLDKIIKFKEKVDGWITADEVR
jgi:hypothetical protein